MLIVLAVAPYPQVWAECRSLVGTSSEGVTLARINDSSPSVFSVNKDHPRLREIIAEVLSLQRTLLINKMPVADITSAHIEKGFLVGESTFESVMESMTRHESELVLVCGGESDELLGYAVLTNMADLEEATVGDAGVFTPSIEPAQWDAFLHNPTHHYIHQIAVHPEVKRQGVGSLLLEACKARSPMGLAADILFEPEPYNNVASYSLFLKRGFADVGMLDIKIFPAFRECRTHMVVWKP